MDVYFIDENKLMQNLEEENKNNRFFRKKWTNR